MPRTQMPMARNRRLTPPGLEERGSQVQQQGDQRGHRAHVKRDSLIRSGGRGFRHTQVRRAFMVSCSNSALRSRSRPWPNTWPGRLTRPVSVGARLFLRFQFEHDAERLAQHGDIFGPRQPWRKTGDLTDPMLRRSTGSRRPNCWSVMGSFPSLR
jgi:hypothetical protein